MRDAHPAHIAAYSSTALKQNFLSRIHYLKKNKVSLLLQAKTDVCAQSHAVLFYSPMSGACMMCYEYHTFIVNVYNIHELVDFR